MTITAVGQDDQWGSESLSQNTESLQGDELDIGERQEDPIGERVRIREQVRSCRDRDGIPTQISVDMDRIGNVQDAVAFDGNRIDLLSEEDRLLAGERIGSLDRSPQCGLQASRV